MMMHQDEVFTSEETVKTLICEQFPAYGHLPVRRVPSIGTVNAIYKIGEEYCARLPRLAWASEALRREWRVLSLLSKHLTFAVPEVVEQGRPGGEYPLDWAIYRWVDGETYDRATVDEAGAAKALAGFIKELRAVKLPADPPKAGRKPLQKLDEVTVKAIGESGEDIDGGRALEVWRELLGTAPWDGNPVWIHADLLKPNLIVREGRLSGVIDFGSAGAGDPAFDLTPAWTVFTAKGRELFKELMAPDEDAWLRAKAYALHQALLIIPYYRESNPDFVKQAKFTVGNIL